jgi:hypothetical protein
MRNIVTEGHYVRTYTCKITLQNYYTKQKRIVIMLHLADPDKGDKNRGLYCGKYPLYGCCASFVQLKIMCNYITFCFVFETGYYA